MIGIAAGELRHLITIERPSGQDVANDYNDEIPDYQPLSKQWAKVEPLSGREAFQAKQVKATTSHKVTLRVFGPLFPTDRFRFEESRVFQIDSIVRPGEINSIYEVLCSEQTPLKGPNQ